MGRYLPTLAPAFADAAGVGPGRRVLDVGCGPGGLTRELAVRTGAAGVAAIDPSEPTRATRPGGVVAARDLAHMQMLRPFWTGVAQALGVARGEVGLLGSREGDLFALLPVPGWTTCTRSPSRRARPLPARRRLVESAHPGHRPGRHVPRSLDGERRRTVRDACRRQSTDPDEPFTLNACTRCATAGDRPAPLG